ncbi:MAG: hypothetical protein Q4B70_08070 [Lachnospiraceae bacterium]|nr:hypothetical protein [Lachnospiraceae bacterium]
MNRQRMKRLTGFFWLFMLSVLWCAGISCEAAEDYFDNPEEIYERFRDRVYDEDYEVEYGFLREREPVYSDQYGSKQTGKAAKYSGIIIVSKTESYVQVIYETKSGYGIGWMDRSRYNEIARLYNGAEKQLLADGEYSMGNVSADSLSQVELVFLKNQQYKILDKKTGRALGLVQKNGAYKHKVCWGKEEDSEAQSWQLIREYDHFYLKNKLSGRYLTLDKENGPALKQLSNDPENCFEERDKEQGPADTWWTFVRTNGKNVNPYRNFLQYDPDWSRKDYGNVDDYSGKMASAGCGVVAITNAVYALNGQFIDPMLLADYAVEKNYRIIGSGTDDGIFKAAAQMFGKAYNFNYLGRCYDIFQVQRYLKAGCVAISHVPGHYVTVADYKDKNEKYLVLDSHPIPRRPTNPFGNWFKWNRLESGGLASSCYYIYSTKTKEDIQNDVQK